MFVCLTEDERFYVLQRLWKSATRVRSSTKKALLESDLQNRACWEAALTPIIAEYL